MEQTQITSSITLRRLAILLSLAVILCAGIFTVVTRGMSPYEIVLFIVSALLLSYLYWKPNVISLAPVGILAVGAVVLSLPEGVVIASVTFGCGLMLAALTLSVFHIL